MKNENGYGGISYMGKNRRNPYRVRITTGWSINPETGRAKQEYVTLGYFPSRKAAMIALAEYNKDPYDLNADKVTLKEAYEAWAKREIETKGPSRKGQLKAAFDKCAPLYNIKMKDMRKKQMQDLMDQYSDLSDTAQSNIKAVFKAVFTYCMENDLVNKDYSMYVKIKPKGSESIHAPYTPEEIAQLWDNLDTEVQLAYSKYDLRPIYPADIQLMLIYTGMRPSELLNMKTCDIHLEDRYMVGGMKTEAGKNRIIPLHSDILPLVEKRMAEAGDYLIPYKMDRPPTLSQFRKYMYDPLMEMMGMDHLPHDGRHTFATYAARFDLNKLMVKMIMGHASKDITEAVYTHRTAAELVEEVNKIVFYEK